MKLMYASTGNCFEIFVQHSVTPTNIILMFIFIIIWWISSSGCSQLCDMTNQRGFITDVADLFLDPDKIQILFVLDVSGSPKTYIIIQYSLLVVAVQTWVL